MKSKKSLGLLFFLFFTLFFGTSLAAYPNLSDYPNFLSPDVYIVVGGEGSATDVLASTEIATGIKGEMPSINIETKLDKEVVNPYGINKNFVLVGSPCKNKFIALIMEKDYPSCGSESGIPENSAIIKIYDGFTSGYYVLVVSGWNDTYTRIAASVLKKHDQYLADKFVKAVKVTSESSSGITSYDVVTSTTIPSVTTTLTMISTTVNTQVMTTTIASKITTSTQMTTTTTAINQEDDKSKLILVGVIFGVIIFLVLTVLLMSLSKRKEI